MGMDGKYHSCIYLNLNSPLYIVFYCIHAPILRPLVPRTSNILVSLTSDLNSTPDTTQLHRSDTFVKDHGELNKQSSGGTSKEPKRRKKKMPSFRRTLDYIYLAFFLIHIPIVICVDIYPLYPPSLIPTFMTDLRRWYIHTYNDQFFVKPPAWFTLYIWLELIYHIPLSLYAVQALWSNADPKTPIHLLIYAIQTAVTTATCIADYMSWGSHTNEQKLELGKLYVPYLMVCEYNQNLPALRLGWGLCELMN
ncbi:hypothetical protein AC578_10117 [Pseudocercospora eumusae]|uniref:EXPERA domain-containing protein n=1 Tax=Pseudocercospora eumusae TaxID=321146 RepID=A0A139HYN5_9PEZI|nr:hypothetical protein AC578_10117 [Pseudocercospora eumusae]